MDFNESPVNYDFFGGQPQISDQHPGMLQSLPRQQSGISDMQLLQQQLMLKQMQEMQRQQQLQKQQEARKMNSINQAAVSPSQALINGIPIRETSNYSWQPELMAANTTWQQRGLSPVMQGSFRGHIFSPEEGQGTPHQVDQSLYGVPISATRVTPSQYSPFPMDKPSMQQILDSSNSLTSNQHAGFPEQVSMQDGTLVSRQGYQGKNMIASSDGQGINTGFNLESLQQLNPQKCNGPVQEICMRQDLAGPSETSQEDTTLQVAPSLNVATLDPTEAQILFGPDDNLWDTFGRGANMGSGGYNMSDSTDFFSSLPSVQSGSWSALMQSAVAETSSGDTGLQEEWSCLNFRNSEPPAKNQLSPSVIDRSKQQSNWAANSLLSASSLNPQPFCPSHEINTDIFSSFQKTGNKWSDRNLIQKAAFEGSHFHGKAIHLSDVGSWANQQSMPSYSSNDHPLNRLGKSTSGWNLMDSVPPSTTAALKNQENEKLFPRFS
ncbi:DENTIN SIALOPHOSPHOPROTEIN-LIKE PROTEIN [Salix viminalis]|uniref:DENTIN SIALOPHOSPHOPROTEIN-LIKE PROTEIN n=1 Tax=Salix viminalis TaxID=40686 RepID=A0A9Q0NMT5_SALVM|nr:DENTIN SIALOPHOSPHOPROTEIN-LIKE PROTEIN [Salix viminalis]